MYFDYSNTTQPDWNTLTGDYIFRIIGVDSGGNEVSVEEPHPFPPPIPDPDAPYAHSLRGFLYDGFCNVDMMYTKKPDSSSAYSYEQMAHLTSTGIPVTLQVEKVV